MGDGTSQGVKAETDHIRALGDSLVSTVGPALEQASRGLADARGVVHTNFTAVTPALAIAYAAAVEYMDPELRSKRTHLDDVSSRLSAIASNWEATERGSTFQLHGRGAEPLEA
jgi:hypothetical protein